MNHSQYSSSSSSTTTTGPAADAAMYESARNTLYQETAEKPYGGVLGESQNAPPQDGLTLFDVQSGDYAVLDQPGAFSHGDDDALSFELEDLFGPPLVLQDGGDEGGGALPARASSLDEEIEFFSGGGGVSPLGAPGTPEFPPYQPEPAPQSSSPPSAAPTPAPEPVAQPVFSSTPVYRTSPAQSLPISPRVAMPFRHAPIVMTSQTMASHSFSSTPKVSLPSAPMPWQTKPRAQKTVAASPSSSEKPPAVAKAPKKDPRPAKSATKDSPQTTTPTNITTKTPNDSEQDQSGDSSSSSSGGSSSDSGSDSSATTGSSTTSPRTTKKRKRKSNRQRRMDAYTSRQQALMRDNRETRRDQLMIEWFRQNEDKGSRKDLYERARAEVENQLNREYVIDAEGRITLISSPVRGKRTRRPPNRDLEVACANFVRKEGEGEEDEEEDDIEWAVSGGSDDDGLDNDDVCYKCNERTSADNPLYCCDTCTGSYHYGCLEPAERPASKEDDGTSWRCPVCTEAEEEEMSCEDHFMAEYHQQVAKDEEAEAEEIAKKADKKAAKEARRKARRAAAAAARDGNASEYSSSDDDDDDDDDDADDDDEEEEEEAGDLAIDLLANDSSLDEDSLRDELEGRRRELSKAQYSAACTILDWLDERPAGREDYMPVVEAVITDGQVNAEDRKVFERMLRDLEGRLSKAQIKGARDLFALSRAHQTEANMPAEDCPSHTTSTSTSNNTEPSRNQQRRIDGMFESDPTTSSSQRQGVGGDATALDIGLLPKPPTKVPMSDIKDRLNLQAAKEGSCGTEFAGATSTLIKKGRFLPAPGNASVWMENPNLKALRKAMIDAKKLMKENKTADDFAKRYITWGLHKDGERVWAFAFFRIRKPDAKAATILVPSGCFATLFPRQPKLFPSLKTVRTRLPQFTESVLEKWACGGAKANAWCPDWEGMQKCEDLVCMGRPDGKRSKKITLPLIDSRALWAEMKDVADRLVRARKGGRASFTEPTGKEEVGGAEKEKPKPKPKPKKKHSKRAKTVREEDAEEEGEEEHPEETGAGGEVVPEQGGQATAAATEEGGGGGGGEDDFETIRVCVRNCRAQELPRSTQSLREDGWLTANQGYDLVREKLGQASSRSVPKAVVVVAAAAAAAETKVQKKRKRAAAGATPNGVDSETRGSKKRQKKGEDEPAAPAPRPRVVDKKAAARAWVAKTKRKAQATLEKKRKRETEEATEKRTQKKKAEEESAAASAAAAAAVGASPPAKKKAKTATAGGAAEAAKAFGEFCEVLKAHHTDGGSAKSAAELGIHGAGGDGAKVDPLVQLLWDATYECPGAIRDVIVTHMDAEGLGKLSAYAREVAEKRLTRTIKAVVEGVAPKESAAYAFPVFMLMAMRIHPFGALPETGRPKAKVPEKAVAAVGEEDDEDEEDVLDGLLDDDDDDDEADEARGMEELEGEASRCQFPPLEPCPTAKNIILAVQKSVALSRKKGRKLDATKVLAQCMNKAYPKAEDHVVKAEGQAAMYLEALKTWEGETDHVGVPCFLLLAWMMMIPSEMVAKVLDSGDV